MCGACIHSHPAVLPTVAVLLIVFVLPTIDVLPTIAVLPTVCVPQGGDLELYDRQAFAWVEHMGDFWLHVWPASVWVQLQRWRPGCGWSLGDAPGTKGGSSSGSISGGTGAGEGEAEGAGANAGAAKSSKKVRKTKEPVVRSNRAYFRMRIAKAVGDEPPLQASQQGQWKELRTRIISDVLNGMGSNTDGSDDSDEEDGGGGLGARSPYGRVVRLGEHLLRKAAAAGVFGVSAPVAGMWCEGGPELLRATCAGSALLSTHWHPRCPSLTTWCG